MFQKWTLIFVIPIVDIMVKDLIQGATSVLVSPLLHSYVVEGRPILMPHPVVAKEK